MPKITVLALCSSMFILHCNNLSTREELDGGFLSMDTNPPAIQSPSPGGLALNKVANLRWAAIKFASNYEVQVATDNNFTNILLKKTIADSFLDVTLPDAVTYYWRVRANLTAAGKYSQGSFEGMDDAVYVYCDASVSCIDDGLVGNKAKPFRTITRALTEASANRIGQVKVAARDLSSTAYREAINLVPKVSLYGGYTSDFKESNRNISTNVTRIYNDGVTAMYAAYLFASQNPPYQQVIVEGLTFETGVTNTNTYGGYVLQSSENLVLRNNIFKSGNSAGETYGLFLSEVTTVSSPNLVVENNTIIAGDPSQSTYWSFGLYIDAGSPVVRNNVILGGNIAAGSTGSIGLRTANSNAVITNNTIRAGSSPAGGSSTGIAMKHTIAGSSSNTITNNIVSTLSGGSTYCMWETNGSCNPASLQSNLVFDCTVFYRDLANGNLSLAQMNTATQSTQGLAATASGNVNVVNFAALYFTSATDLHIKSTTPVGVKQGGKAVQTGQNTCGALGTASCGAVDTDKDGSTRTSPLSIGAYEMDL